MRRMLIMCAVVGSCVLCSSSVRAWTIESYVSPDDEDTAPGYGAYAHAEWDGTLADTYAKVWDVDVAWEEGWATANVPQKEVKKYVTGTPAATECDEFHYRIAGSVYAKCNGESANGAPGAGVCASYGYAKVIGNASDGYNADVKVECDGSANEAGGWTVSVFVLGATVQYNGEESYYSKTASDDWDKEANVDGGDGAPFAKLTLTSKAESSGSNGADGPQEGKGKATKVAVTLTLNE